MDAYWRLTGRMLRQHRGRLGVAMLFAVVSASGLGAGLVAVTPVLEIILRPDDGRGLQAIAADHNTEDPLVRVPTWLIEQLPTEPFRSVLTIVCALAVLTLIGAGANFLHQYLSQTVVARHAAELRREAFGRILEMPLARVTSRGASELVTRVVRDVAELQHGIIALVSKSVTQVCQGCAGLAAAIYHDWRLTLVAIVVAPILGVTLRKIGKFVRRGNRGSLRAQEGLLRVATECAQGLRSVKANQAEAQSVDRFAALNEEVVHHELRLRTARAASAPIVETIAMLSIGALAVVAAKEILDGSLELEKFILALTGVGVAGGAFRPLSGLVTRIQEASAPAERLGDLLDEPVEAPTTVAEPVELPRLRRSIDLVDVTLRYPGAEHSALDGVSLSIRRLERIAIVGPNGSGKTTLVSLIPRLLVPSAGRIEIDGIDLATVDLASLRRQIAVVTQETMLFRGTVAENIAFGSPDADQAAVEQAARRAHADLFIEKLPGRYEEVVAEQGASLSGGQRQRIAIARAILRDPSILILDEATSQIDAESEAHISQALMDFCEHRTVLIIAHRLATVLHADRIVVMDRGSIVDVGDHETLLGRCPLYQRLARTQLAVSEAG